MGARSPQGRAGRADRAPVGVGVLRTMWTFVSDERRWIGAGLMLTFFSAFGQTWFISLFAGPIKATHGLTDGGWGLVFTAATLVSALALLWRGGLADTVPLGLLAPRIAVLFAASAALLSVSWTLGTLLLAVCGLRFCGQGMFSHVALTAMGRWFRLQRGRAVSLAIVGYSISEVTLVFPVVALIAGVGWRPALWITAAALAVIVAPAVARLYRRDRPPQTEAEAASPTTGIDGRHWTQAEMLRHWLFWALVPFLLTPGFVATVIFFHQIHIAEIKGWTLAQMAGGYPFHAAFAVISALGSGWLMDRLGPSSLLPVLLVPMGIGVALIGTGAAPETWFLSLALVGMTLGAYGTFWGAMLPAAYGGRHLGEVRALVTAIILFSTAIGPAATGLLIDAGSTFPEQATAIGAWCLALSVLGLLIQRRLARRMEADQTNRLTQFSSRS